jgi:fatty acid desaturase
MIVAVRTTPRRLFRDREDAFANTLVLLVTSAGWLGSFALMASNSPALNVLGLLLCAHAMVMAAYLVHEAAHQTLFAIPRVNRWVGETMSFMAGSPYASFERIRHMHIRHHLDRADLICFDFKRLLGRRPTVRRALQICEWAYIPATECLMHLQVVWRPFFVRSQRRYLPRAAAMLVVRTVLLIGLWSFAPKAVTLRHRPRCAAARAQFLRCFPSHL